MTSPAASPTPRRSKRIYVLWAVALTLLLAAGAFCWLVVAPLMEAHASVGRCIRRSEKMPGEVQALGGPRRAARLLRLYVRFMPKQMFEERRFAVMMLGYCDWYGVPVLIEVLEDEDEGPELRAEAAEHLGASKDPRAFGPLTRVFHGPRQSVSFAAAMGLATADSGAPLAEAILKGPPAKRDIAVEALKFGKCASAERPLNAALTSKDPSARQEAAKALEEIQNKY
jgi:hypothetical protein